MNSEEIVDILKDNYPRDVRKQLVKTIIANEKDNDKNSLQQQYQIMNQIFSYVLKECNWTMPKNSSQLDHKPLKIMAEVFPKLDTTKWYNDQLLIAKQSIDVVINE